MKIFSKLFGLIVVFMMAMVVFCSVGFAEEINYTDNLIPTMTNDTTPSGKASASSNWELKNFPTWRAFDHTNIYSWASGRNKKAGWLEYDFPEGKCISKYTLISRAHIASITELPRDWTFEGWDEQLSKWIVLDTRENVIDWQSGVKKEFTFTNTSFYKKYRINITANSGWADVVIGEMEMMAAKPIIAAPANLTATAGNAKVDLKWDAVEGAISYNIKRATTVGGTYTTIAENVNATNYKDITVTNGTTYYYVVSAVTASGESSNSNEVSAIPQTTNQLKLVIEVNEEKQLSITDELSNNTEMEWSSFDATIATVDENGKVKALKSGNTVISCTSKDKSYAESINVLVVDLEYQLAVDLSIGDKCRLTVDDLANATNVTWSSYDSTIATVTAKGKVTAVSEGLIYIVANDKDGKEIGRIYLRVRK